MNWGRQKNKIGLSLEPTVDDPLKTIESFNRQFNLNQPQKDAVEWAWPQEMGDTMFAWLTRIPGRHSLKVCPLRIHISCNGWVEIFWVCSIKGKTRSGVRFEWLFSV